MLRYRCCATINVIVTAPMQAGSLSLSATVGGQIPDSTPDNDSGSVTSNVNVDVKVKAKVKAGAFGVIELLLLGLAVALLRLIRARRRTNAGALMSVVALCGLIMGSPLSSEAAEIDWFVGLGGGSASSNYDSSTFAPGMASLGHTVSNVSIDDSSTGYKAFGGMTINQFFGVELGYVDLGESTLSFDANTNDPAQMVADAGTLLPVSGSGVSFAAIGRYPFGDRGAVFAKLGGFSWTADAPVEITSGGVAQSDDSSPDGTDLLYGIGGDLYFPGFLGGRLGGRLEWERYAFDNNDVDLVSLSLLFRF
jgi:OOP family OmpA-OmpF porin